MNMIILNPEIEAWLSSLAPTMPALNLNETNGWKTEAERLAQGARLRVREPRQ